MRSILVATDFSAASLNAARYAAIFSRKTGAELTLLHVYMLPTPVGDMPYVMISAEEIQLENEKQMDKIAGELEPVAGKKIKTQVNIGLPDDEVVYQSTEQGADLIVTGMRGSSSALNKLIGSTSAAIIRKSKLPVLVVPAGHHYKNIHTISFATDFKHPMSENSLQHLQYWLAANPGTSLQIVHVQQPGDEPGQVQLNNKSALGQKLGGIQHSFFNEKHDSVEDGLDQFLTGHPSQLLVMVSHRHSWWHRLLNNSHTARMAYRADLPLLVLEDK
ncbi:MAG: universal stress protein [Flavihumibacter sp.]